MYDGVDTHDCLVKRSFLRDRLDCELHVSKLSGARVTNLGEVRDICEVQLALIVVQQEILETSRFCLGSNDNQGVVTPVQDRLQDPLSDEAICTGNKYLRTTGASDGR